MTIVVCHQTGPVYQAAIPGFHLYYAITFAFPEQTIPPSCHTKLYPDRHTISQHIMVLFGDMIYQLTNYTQMAIPNHTQIARLCYTILVTHGHHCATSVSPEHQVFSPIATKLPYAFPNNLTHCVSDTTCHILP